MRPAVISLGSGVFKAWFPLPGNLMIAPGDRKCVCVCWYVHKNVSTQSGYQELKLGPPEKQYESAPSPASVS